MKTYLVGGAVRDQLLGVPVRERDWVLVGAREEDLLAQGYRRLDKGFPVFLHPVSGDECALARRERKVSPGYKGFVVDAGPDVTLEQDLVRRDFRVNAMAMDEAGNLIDPWGGQQDLAAGLLHHVSPAFIEDPVRLVRGARFCAQLGPLEFRVAPPTQDLLKHMATFPELETLLPDRFRDELLKSMAAARPWRFVRVLEEWGALQRLAPPLHRALSTGPKLLAGLERASAATANPAIRLTALLAPTLDTPDQANDLARDWGLGRAERDLLVSVAQWPIDRVIAPDGDRLLHLFGSLRAFQQPERLRELLLVWRSLDPELGDRVARAVTSAFDAARRVDTRPLIEAGYQGAQLGQQVQQQRLGAIRESLASSRVCYPGEIAG